MTLSRWKVDPVNTVFNLCPITAKFGTQSAVEKKKQTQQPKLFQGATTEMIPLSRKFFWGGFYEAVPPVGAKIPTFRETVRGGTGAMDEKQT